MIVLKNCLPDEIKNVACFGLLPAEPDSNKRYYADVVGFDFMSLK